MAVFLMIAMWIRGDGLIRPLELVGSIWYGEFTTGAGVALLGLASHLAASIVLGIAWAYVFSYVKVAPLVTGTVFGAAVALLMGYVVLPVTNFIIGNSASYDTVFVGSTPHKIFHLGAGDGFALWMVLAGYVLFGLTLGAFEEWADRRRVGTGRRV